MARPHYFWDMGVSMKVFGTSLPIVVVDSIPKISEKQFELGFGYFLKFASFEAFNNEPPPLQGQASAVPTKAFKASCACYCVWWPHQTCSKKHSG